MNFIKSLFRQHNWLKKLYHIDEDTVISLYSISQKSVLFAFIFVILTGAVLYPLYLDHILIWSFFLLAILVYRFYIGYLFKKDISRYTLTVWYNIFVVSAILTAMGISALSVICMPNVEDIYQLFIIMSLIGFSAGATTSLASDVRLAIIYITIIIIPLIYMLFIVAMPFHNILAFLAVIYYITQITIIYNTYKQKIKLEQLEDEKVLLDNLFYHAPLGMFMYDKELNIIDCNEQFLKLFDNKREDMIHFNLNNIPDIKPLSALKKALSEGSQTYVGKYISTKGKEFWIEAKIFPYKDKFQDTQGSIVLIEDKSKERKIQEELEYVASHDALTGLRNRRGLRQSMQEVVNSSKHTEYYSLLFYLDLNQFKGINDSLGHTIGDAVLLNVSKRLKYSLDDVCHISRLGGDEFIILVPFASKDEISAKREAEIYASKIQNIFTEPFIIEDLHLHIHASMGVIIIEPKYTNIEEIIRHADITMYHAKNDNSNISYYNESFDKKQKELFVLQHNLAYAVDKNQLEIFFQPIVKIKDEKLYACEALIRWHHPEKGLLMPGAFISLAIKAGLLSKITWWLLETVCTQISQWKKLGLWHLEYVSINVNAQQLIENSFADEFLSRVKKHGLSTHDIIIEITERSLVDNFDSTQNVISKLRAEGVRCAIDDFGVGYSSLSYLKKLSFHTLKIDKEFVKNIESNPKELLLLSTILNIGKQFNYHIVIEGIEDKRQKDLLLGLDEALSYQGYYVSPPLQAKEFREKFLF